MEARGPFGSPSEALGNCAEWVAMRFPETPDKVGSDAPDGDKLATFLLSNAEGFLACAVAAAAKTSDSEVVLASACYALELVLKAYLASRGRSDDWLREAIRHDLVKAMQEAVFYGLPGDDARIGRFLKVAAEAYARHQLFERSRERPNLLAETDYLTAIRVLHGQVESRFEFDRELAVSQRVARLCTLERTGGDPVDLRHGPIQAGD